MRRVFALALCTALIGTAATFVAHAQSTDRAAVATRQAELQAQLNQIEGQIQEQQGLINQAEAQKQSLESDIALLDAQIKKAKLQLQETQLTINSLSNNIGAHNATLAQLSDQLAGEKESLAEIMRKTQELDSYSAVVVALGSQNVSTFFADLDAFVSVKAALADSFDQIQTTSSSTEAEKEALQNRLAEQEQLKTIEKLEEAQIQSRENQKQQVLTATKGQEAAYQKLLSTSQKSAAQIRSELFTLRDSAAIPFGQALTYASAAGRATGVAPALILGILKQETQLGAYIGSGTWRVDMNPTRDQPVFPYLMQTLGLDPDNMPVSKRPSYGWGGAMGPAQIIPSTWVCYGGFVNSVTGDCNNSHGTLPASAFWQGPWQYVASKDRIRKLVGGTGPSNPWDDQAAFMAVGLLMADNGAAGGTPYTERLAALRYFAGWSNAGNPAYAFYGDAVMQFEQQFKQEIAVVLGS